MTITALLELQVKPESVESAPAVIHDVLAATRAFDGCGRVDVIIDVADPAHFMIVEHWDSLEADAAYRAWRKTPEGASDLGSILAAPPKLIKYEIDENI